MDTDEMPTKIVFAAEGAATRAMGAGVGFEPIRIVRRHMGLEVIGPCES